MNETRFSRSSLLLGNDSIEQLSQKRVAVFGVGGVGGYTTEALARTGIAQFDLFDPDTVNITNINRQIIALTSTVGRLKVDVMKERILDINPDARVQTYPVFYMPECADDYPLDGYDYVIDAIDTVTAKLELIVRCNALHIPVISCMGAGNKLNPMGFEVTDITKTSVCPLAKVMRRELKLRGITHHKVVYSKEPPISVPFIPSEGRRATPGSIAFVPSAAGLLLASEVIKDLTTSSLS